MRNPTPGSGHVERLEHLQTFISRDEIKWWKEHRALDNSRLQSREATSFAAAEGQKLHVVHADAVIAQQFGEPYIAGVAPSPNP
jgi:hypothetical protein